VAAASPFSKSSKRSSAPPASIFAWSSPGGAQATPPGSWRRAIARALLGWQPKLSELSTIVAHALAWERKRMAPGTGRAHAG
jgi:hypothetical protein